MNDQRTTDHYTSDELAARLLSAVDDAYGPEVTAADLAGVDQFHLGGRAATSALLEHLDLGPDSAALDVGSGIGGVARQVAAAFGCRVTGVDLTPAFVDAAVALSDRVGLGGLTTFQTGNALQLPFGDGAFDATTLIHVGMNIDDKAALAQELRRVTRDGGTVVVYDIMRLDDRPLTYPTPWASDASIDFIASISTYLEALGEAGLSVGDPQDHSALVLDVIQQLRVAPPALNLGHLMGPNWPTMFGNLVDALRAGTVAPIAITSTA